MFRTENIVKRLIVVPIIGFLLILTIGMAIRLDNAPRFTHGDQDYFFRVWTYSALNDGPWAIYRNSNMNHPPLSLYPFWLTGLVYTAGGGSLELIGLPGTTPVLKVPAIISDAALMILAFWFGLKNSGWKLALLLMALIALNPVIINNSAMWGQTDSIFTLFLVLSLIAIILRRWALAGICVTLSLTTKFQAAVMIPALLTFILWPRTPTVVLTAGLPGMIRAAWAQRSAAAQFVGSFGVVFALIMAPFIAGSGFTPAMRG